MTTSELKKAAEGFRKQAEKATDAGMRVVFLKKARNCYTDAGLTGMAAWCERHLG